MKKYRSIELERLTEGYLIMARVEGEDFTYDRYAFTDKSSALDFLDTLLGENL